ncbi:purine-binding chemotaxis protein CheW [Leptospira bourretii]|uniref:Purine-binding chemotaxis protein CheW n=1 Tax=Leptospira bourretii TaxID=2484962 RepID=A0A4R9IMV7_9LEPT|nr:MULTISPECIES: chemotaxis protein CheW [Leptospira]MCG6140977.1 chemotaxis protein CheW [Leptospira mtsangambouensis]TGK84777.1 purine-binding chemotaxis protein CheW [Leptospira bourretii]TGK90544.1 purine-binding chemotaxis protein CheW [Leptospira bourretii]TGL21572.1 purine-binding chemotaxis protein CheW [Leptospira bourretii]TGL26990.1 purine-binding chemotaxis protein CheW [Leptospira bourretii]
MQELQYLTFLISEELFGLGILYIKEIIEFESVTHVPMMPEYIPGVINLRGNVVPVIDLNMRFYRKKTETNRKTCIIITEIKLENEIIDVGLLVDAVNEVVDITPESIEEPPSFGSKIRLDFIQGLGKLENKFVIILKVNQILELSELQSIQESSSNVV